LEHATTPVSNTNATIDANRPFKGIRCLWAYGELECTDG